MTAIAAVDVGSNGIRLAIGQLIEDHDPQVVETLREPVRLGHDVFTCGAITEETTRRAIEAFQRFRDTMHDHGVKRCRAIGTSALREAANQDVFVDRVFQASGIEIQVTSPEEEARLVHRAVSNSIELKKKRALLIDIGGGSVEIVLSDNSNILSINSLKIGTVRLLELLQGRNGVDDHFAQLARDYVRPAKKWFEQQIGKEKIDLCVGVGGNVECLGELGKDFFSGKKENALSLEKLDEMLEKLQKLTYEERISQLHLRPDRADVIVPAGIVLQALMKQAKADEILIPNVSLKEGLLLELAEELETHKKPLHRDEVIHSAIQVGRKFQFDEAHGKTVAGFAIQLFDETQPLHKLNPDFRLLLEVAALLHDIGRFIHPNNYHKHTYYLVRETPIVGLSRSQRTLIASVARYHRKSVPTPQQDPYRELSHQERIIVSKLAALLRLAVALDFEQENRVLKLRVSHKKHQLLLELDGESDLLLEQWAVRKRSALFEEVFGIKIAVERRTSR